MKNNPLRNKALLIALMLLVGLIAAACGTDDPIPLAAPSGGDGVAGAADPEPTTPPAAPSPTAAATISSTELGDVLAGSNGLTLYGFTNDVEAKSTCYGTCADAWPPVIVDAGFAVAPGLDVGIFATTERDDGQLQLVAGKWPLYFFAGDAIRGDLAGQGSGDVWFAVDLAGSLIRDDLSAPVEQVAGEAADDAVAPPLVGIATSDLGEILVDANGLSLYGFTNDVDGQPTCVDACADAWPPILVDQAVVPDGLDPEIFSVVERPDGSLQLRAGVWPLYLFAGDGAPGDLNGQGSGDVWFLATPDGGLIRGDVATQSAEASTSGY